MTVGGINGLLAYNSLEEVRAATRRRNTLAAGSTREHAASEPALPATDAPEKSRSPGELSDAEKKEVARLQARDREVRSHEQAHKAVAGAHARGGPKYTTTRGPDGRSYATEGSVSIDTSPIPGEPEKTIAKMQQVRRAALAPSEPSSQDARVAADAAQKANEARLELAREQQAGLDGEAMGDEPNTDATQFGVSRNESTEVDSVDADQDQRASASASHTASSLEERYARAGGDARERAYTGYRLDVRV